MPSIRLHVVWSRPTTLTDDVVITTFDFGVVGSTWPEAAPRNYETCETALDAWWNALRVYYSNEHVLGEFRWYREDDDTPPWGPPARVTTRNVPGTSGANCLPPQVAVTCTERTSNQSRKHWGRFYMPAPAVNGLPGDVLQPDGRISSGFMTLLADRTKTMYDALSASGLQPIVRCKIDGLPVSAEIQEIAVDDIFDVMRSRRYSHVGSRQVRTLVDATP